MTHITQLIRRKTISPAQILTMVLATLVSVILQSSTVHAQSLWTTAGTNDIRNTNSGNVGIGTTSPTQTLDVQAATSSAQIKSTTGTNRAYLVTVNTGGSVIMGSESIAGQSLFNIGTLPYAGVFGTTGARAVHIATNQTARMTVDSSGNVGIGTTAPGALLDLASSTQLNNRLLLSGQEYFAPGNTSTSGVVFRLGVNRTGERQVWIADSSHAINSTNAQLRMRFFTSSASLDALSTDGNFTRPLTLQSVGGNVGIGTASPIYSLDVNGGANGFRAKAATTASGDAIATFENAGGIQAIVRGNGNVGIGVTSPGAKLEVGGNVNVTGTGNITATGTITGGNIIAKYQDMAEWVPASRALPVGTVVTLDPTRSNHVEASSKAYDTRVAGVISAQPGIALGESGENKVLVATTGRVRIKVDASRGAIKVGDLLVTSDVEGVAMKSKPVLLGEVEIHRPGTLIGKALEPLEKGTGEILVLLSLQ